MNRTPSSSDYPAQRLVCTTCGAAFVARDPAAAAAVPAPFAPEPAHVPVDRGADLLETRLSALVRAVDAARVLGASADRPARRTPPAAIALLEPARPALEVGPLRAVFGGPHGTRIERTDATAVALEPWAIEPHRVPPPADARPAATAAVWAAFAGGASVVHITAAPGAGATTLLDSLAAHAGEHGFVDGAIFASDTNGPGGDVAQRLAARLDAAGRARYLTRSEILRNCGAKRALVLLDRANLSAEDVAELHALFPSACFAIADRSDAIARSAARSVSLGPLDARGCGELLEAACGRRIDADNQRAAQMLCTTIGALPGPVRLIGVAARELRRSLISLHVQFGSGGAIVRELIAGLPAAERRILGIMALAHAPLAAHHLAYVIRSAHIQGALDRLEACELIASRGDSMYELPRYVEPFVPALSDGVSAFARVIDVCCDVIDSSPAVPVLDRQLAAAEALLHRAASQPQSGPVLALGLRLAPMIARRGAFGAWGRVLEVVEAAAARGGDTAALSLVRHERAVRSLLLGEYKDTVALLQTVAPERRAAGDEDGAAADEAILSLAQAASAAVAATPARTLVKPPRTIARPQPRALAEPLRPARVEPPALGTSEEPSGSARTPTPPTARRRPPSLPALILGSLGIAAAAVFGISQLPRPTPAPPAPPAITAAPVSAIGPADTFSPEPAPAFAAQPLAIAAFSASPARIAAGGSTRLCYAVTGADVLRMVPRVGDLTRLRSCRTIVLREPHRYRYILTATGDNGQYADRQVQVDVVAVPRHPADTRRAALAAQLLTRHAIYQFDVTPRVVLRGQAASLCAGVDRSAHGYLTHVGPLPPGITRCYRIAPRTTTIYRLYVSRQHAAAVETVVLAVRPGHRRRDVARNESR